LKVKKRQKEEADHIQDTKERLVTEIEMLKVVMHLAASRRKHFPPLPLTGKKLI
jgi:hypothetical protein